MAEVKREYYPTGELESEWFEINGKKEGEFKLYYNIDCESNHENVSECDRIFYGQLMIIYSYVGDKLHGEYKQYYSNGQLSCSVMYIDDKRNGEYKRYFESGQLEEICLYIDGEINGEFKQYHENGELLCITSYTNDKLHGKYTSYHNNGQINKHYLYHHGEKIESYNKKLN